MPPGSRRPTKSVCLIGLGNIGSPLASLLARLTDLVDRIILVDNDSYDWSNLSSQEIGSRDVGRPKAIATAERLHQINPRLEAVPLQGKVEWLPRAMLRADVILAALDSLRARTFVNEIATRLAVPWVDTGVEPDGRLARVTVYRPDSDGPCMECGLTAAHYDTMDHALPCAGDSSDALAGEAPSTRAPAYLGALAASLAAAECEELLAGDIDGSLARRELVVSAKYHTHFVTNLGRNPNCRFDHSTWSPEKLVARPHDISVGQVLDGRLLAGRPGGRDTSVELRVEPHRFVTRTRCGRCRNVGDDLFLSGRPANPPCSVCGGSRVPQHFYTLDRLTADALPDHLRRQSLADIGLQRGDLFSISSGTAERHFELGV
jgi:molybdopterin/thiamine biosynthesis adenylyltransferase